MPNPLIYAPAVCLLALGAGALQAHLTTWGPREPAYTLVMEYRTDSYVLDSHLTQDDCDDALPFGDQLKHVHFSCVVEG